MVLVARRSELLDEVASVIEGNFGVQTVKFVADLSEPALVDALVSACSPLNVTYLVAAAGFGSSGDLIHSDIANERRMLRLNCEAVMVLCREFGRRMVEQRRGAIVLFSSIVAFQGVPKSAHYAATKAYIQSLAEGLAVELKPHGVCVVSSAPGPIETGFGVRAGMRMGQAALQPQIVALQTLASIGVRTTVRPGALSKILGWGLAALPRPLRVRVMGRVMQNMTKRA